MIAARIRRHCEHENIAGGLSRSYWGQTVDDGVAGACGNSANLFRVSCKFGCDGFVTVEDNIVATHLYRIAQEAVTNAVKHGGAKKILLRPR
jgi:hypothetical protein